MVFLQELPWLRRVFAELATSPIASKLAPTRRVWICYHEVTGWAQKRENMNNTAPDSQWEALFHNPDMYLLEFTDQQALFVGMTRESYKQSIFTDRPRIVPAQPAGHGINLDKLLEQSEY